jgi:hypothetical protein
MGYVRFSHLAVTCGNGDGGRACPQVKRGASTGFCGGLSGSGVGVCADGLEGELLELGEQVAHLAGVVE